MKHLRLSSHRCFRQLLRRGVSPGKKPAALRNALIEGENSGPSTEFDFAAFIERKRGSSAPRT